jgi:hypothetical protein
MMRCTQSCHGPKGGIAVRILDLFCSVDEFWQRFEPVWQRERVAAGRRRRRRGRMSPSELMTILILFPQSPSRTFKAFYTQHVQR